MSKDPIVIERLTALKTEHTQKLRLQNVSSVHELYSLLHVPSSSKALGEELGLNEADLKSIKSECETLLSAEEVQQLRRSVEVRYRLGAFIEKRSPERPPSEGDTK